MIESGRRARFLLKASQTIHVTGKNWGQDFDGDFAPENRIVRAIYFAHAARAQRRDDLIWPEFGTRG